MKLLLVAAAFLALAVPTALAVPPAGHGNHGSSQAGEHGNASDTSVNVASTGTNAAKLCKAERLSLGVDAFDAKYGTNANKKNAFGKCVSQKARQLVLQQQAKTNAAKLCKAERLSLGVDAFDAKYGTNANKKNAFGKCVSQHAKAKSGSSS